MNLLATKKSRTVEEPKLLTVNEAEAAAAAYTKADEVIRQIESQKRTEMMEVEQKYTEDLRAHTEQRTAAEVTLVKYAAQIELDKATKKSANILGITIGFRAGKSKLTLLDGFDWDKVREAIKKSLPIYVRNVEELEKDRLVKDFAGDDSLLETLGLRIDKEGKFYVKLD